MVSAPAQVQAQQSAQAERSALRTLWRRRDAVRRRPASATAGPKSTATSSGAQRRSSSAQLRPGAGYGWADSGRLLLTQDRNNTSVLPPSATATVSAAAVHKEQQRRGAQQHLSFLRTIRPDPIVEAPPVRARRSSTAQNQRWVGTPRFAPLDAWTPGPGAYSPRRCPHVVGGCMPIEARGAAAPEVEGPGFIASPALPKGRQPSFAPYPRRDFLRHERDEERRRRRMASLVVASAPDAGRRSGQSGRPSGRPSSRTSSRPGSRPSSRADSRAGNRPGSRAGSRPGVAGW